MRPSQEQLSGTAIGFSGSVHNGVQYTAEGQLLHAVGSAIAVLESNGSEYLRCEDSSKVLQYKMPTSDLGTLMIRVAFARHQPFLCADLLPASVSQPRPARGGQSSSLHGRHSSHSPLEPDRASRAALLRLT